MCDFLYVYLVRFLKSFKKSQDQEKALFEEKNTSKYKEKALIRSCPVSGWLSSEWMMKSSIVGKVTIYFLHGTHTIYILFDYI